MANQYYCNYVIFFKNEAEYTFAQGVAGGLSVALAPAAAAALFGITYPSPPGDLSTLDSGIYFIQPFTPGEQLMYPGASGVFLDDSVLSVTIPGQAGNPASIWPAGPAGTFTWSGNIVLSGGTQAATVQSYASPPTMSRRRWALGGELTLQNEGGTAYASFGNACRDASRTIDGLGWMVRGGLYNLWEHLVDENISGYQPRASWERLYVRFRRAPSTNDTGFWRCKGSPSSNGGAALKYTTAGTVTIIDVNAVNGEVVKATAFTPVINQWYKLDILLRYGSGGTPSTGVIQLYVDGIFAGGYTSGSGMDGNDRHVSSSTGKWNGVTEHECEIDIDDWICSDIPSNCNAGTLLFSNAEFPLDWVLGSHVRVHYTQTASQTNWTPASPTAKGVQNQVYSQTRVGTSQITSNTSGAISEGLTDAQTLDIADSINIVIGAISALIALRNINGSGTDGTLGYKLAGGAAVMTTINQINAEQNNFVSYNMATAAPMIIPAEIAPWSILHAKSLNTNTDNNYMMLSIVEYLGYFGDEDGPVDLPISRLTFLHNAPYGNSAWGYLGSQPQAPVYAIGGTYLGNGTSQEITLPAPCNFLWIRATSGTSLGCKFFSAAVQPHYGGTNRFMPNVRMWYDFTNGTFQFSVTGAATSDCNVSGTTYQYIAFCDPGMRFSLNGAYSHSASAVVPKVNPLIDSGFLANFGFFQSDSGEAGTTVGLYQRGPGSTGFTGASLAAGGVLTNMATFAAGHINTYSDGNGSAPWNYSLWRTADSGGVCAGIMVQIMTYTGNGSSPRTITLTPTSLRVPLLVVVAPITSALAYMRDPSHTGTNSTQVGDGTNSTTAIIAVGVDSIQVQSSLNANGVVYNVFAICGGTTNVNGEFIGDYCDGSGPYIDPNPVQGDIIILTEGGIDLDGTTPTTLLKDVSGIYTLVPGQRHDVLYDRQTGQTSVETAIPDIQFKTGYVGG